MSVVIRKTGMFEMKFVLFREKHSSCDEQQICPTVISTFLNGLFYHALVFMRLDILCKRKRVKND